MSKEMIERAKDWLGNMKEIANEQTDIDKMEHMKERIEVQDWLIKQAERAHELESESYNAHLERLLDKKERQNKRYREALEFYASKEMYDPELRSEAVYENGICISPPDIEPPDIYFDKGKAARKALEGEE